jgi:hypothetical protein
MHLEQRSPGLPPFRPSCAIPKWSGLPQNRYSVLRSEMRDFSARAQVRGALLILPIASIRPGVLAVSWTESAVLRSEIALPLAGLASAGIELARNLRWTEARITQHQAALRLWSAAAPGREDV